MYNPTNCSHFEIGSKYQRGDKIPKCNRLFNIFAKCCRILPNPWWKKSNLNDIKSSKLATILPFLTRLLVMLQWSQRISDLNHIKFNTFPNSILHWKIAAIFYFWVGRHKLIEQLSRPKGKCQTNLGGSVANLKMSFSKKTFSFHSQQKMCYLPLFERRHNCERFASTAWSCPLRLRGQTNCKKVWSLWSFTHFNKSNCNKKICLLKKSRSIGVSAVQRIVRILCRREMICWIYLCMWYLPQCPFHAARRSHWPCFGVHMSPKNEHISLMLALKCFLWSIDPWTNINFLFL